MYDNDFDKMTLQLMVFSKIMPLNIPLLSRGVCGAIWERMGFLRTTFNLITSFIPGTKVIILGHLSPEPG